MNRNRKLNIILILCFLLCMSCQTERMIIKPPLPEFNPNRPSRPNLISLEDDVQLPVPVLTNTILLQGYAMELEAYADGWEEFYKKLREEYATDQ